MNITYIIYMKTITTLNQSYYNNSIVHFSLPPYSKLLDVFIDSSMFRILYEYDSNYSDNPNKKYYDFRILTDSNFTFNDYGYEYFKTIIEEEPPTLSNYSNGNQINLSIVNGYKKYFYIFVHEMKSIEESRDEKLENLLE